MTETNDSSTYVVTREAVQRAIKSLENISIHEHFAGYLAVLRAVSAGQQSVQSKAIWDFHRDYLEAKTENGRVVFVSPFASRGSSALHEINSNVSGSYGSSSVREGSALAGVIEVQGAGKSATYSLRANHALLAKTKLLKNKKIPAISLAIFLYRDYGLHLDSKNIHGILEIFRKDFGFTDSDINGKKNFDTLFTNDWGLFGPDDLEIVSDFINE